MLPFQPSFSLDKENHMTIKVGDRLPEGKLSESIEFDAACPMPPKDVSVIRCSWTMAW